MILLSTPSSPFGRKVKMAARIHGLFDRIRIEKADPWAEGDVLHGANPLGKMPALITPDGAAIYDSSVILEYFDTLLDRPHLFPVERNIETRVFHALANGMIEAGILIAYERLRRPAEFCYQPWIDHQRRKLARGLASLTERAPDPKTADAAAITLACALGYFDWRKQIDWRQEFPALVAWLDAFRAAFPAFDETAGGERH
jgi:glutathione S-transferase